MFIDRFYPFDHYYYYYHTVRETANVFKMKREQQNNNEKNIYKKISVWRSIFEMVIDRITVKLRDSIQCGNNKLKYFIRNLRTPLHIQCKPNDIAHKIINRNEPRDCFFFCFSFLSFHKNNNNQLSQVNGELFILCRVVRLSPSHIWNLSINDYKRNINDKKNERNPKAINRQLHEWNRNTTWNVFIWYKLHFYYAHFFFLFWFGI